MKKRGIIAILGLSMLLGLTACGGKKRQRQKRKVRQ